MRDTKMLMQRERSATARIGHANCRENGVERFIFGSSDHAVGMDSRQQRTGSGQRVRPDSRCGWSKAAGEAMAAMYADPHGMRCPSLRIGNVADAPAHWPCLSTWTRPEDPTRLFVIGIEHPDLHHAMVYGASGNSRRWRDNTEAARLGYRPRHRAEDHAAGVQAVAEPADPTGDALQGAVFGSAEFSGDLGHTLFS